MKGREHSIRSVDTRANRALAWIATLAFGSWFFLRSLGAAIALPAHQRALAELAILVLGGLLVAWASWRALTRQFPTSQSNGRRVRVVAGAPAQVLSQRELPPVPTARRPGEISRPFRADASELSEDLGGALDRGEIALTLGPDQPGRCTRELALRAALQWHHPVLGTMGQEEIESIARDPDFHTRLRRFVLENTLDACRRLSRAGKRGGVRLRLALADLNDRELRELVRDYFVDFDPPPVRLQLELPAEAFHAGPARERMLALRRAGAHPVLHGEDGARG